MRLFMLWANITAAARAVDHEFGMIFEKQIGWRNNPRRLEMAMALARLILRSWRHLFDEIADVVFCYNFRRGSVGTLLLSSV